MRALQVSDYGAPLQLNEIPVPSPGRGQVLVENHFTSLNKVDLGRASGALRQVFQLTFPWTPGGDVAGRVAAIGDGVRSFKVGDEVYGYTMEAGAYAEFVLIDAIRLAHRPPSITTEQAAAIALVGQTATQMLQLAKVQSGQTLFILGGAGGVGSIAVQLARNSNIRVVATARPSQAAALRDLGAERIIDYPRERLEGFEAEGALNMVGGETVAPSYAVVKRGGVAVTANQPPLEGEAARLGIETAFVQTEITAEGLNAFASLVTEGKVKPLIAGIETLWSPESLWKKRAPETVGRVVFSIRS